MTDQICEILKNAISGLSFVDKITGLVQVGYLTQGEVIKKIGKEFAYEGLTTIKAPISQGYVDCNTTKPYSYDLYFPDKNRKSVIFFEENGITLKEQNRNYIKYMADIRLICWYNKKLIDVDVERFDLIHNINNLIVDEHANSGDINRIYAEFKGQAVHSEDIWSKYDIDVPMYQLMLHPYDCFALDYEVEFSVTKSCIDDVVINPSVC